MGPGRTPDKVEDPPPTAADKVLHRQALYVTQADPESGEVIYHHGGTYTLDGDTYKDTILYSTGTTPG